MRKTILDLFTYPGKTIESLLTERNFVKSTQIFFLTMMIVSISSVLSLYLLLRGKTELSSMYIALAAISPIAGLLLTRLLFRYLVRFGIFMVAKQALPQDPTGRQLRSKELYLLYPYHVLPSIIPAIVFPLVAAPVTTDSFHLLTKLILMIGFTLLAFGVLVYQLLVMTFIVKSVYRVTIRQAFWGPMLAYFLFFILFGLLSTVIVLFLSITLHVINVPF